MNYVLQWPEIIAAFLVGGTVAGALVLSLRTTPASRLEESESLSDGATEILEALSSAAVVMDERNFAVRATQGALAYGLLRERSLVHEELEELVEKARRTQVIESLNTELMVGLRRQSVFVHVRAARVGEGRVLLLLEDRTESKRLDDTRRDFIANISHELKTPIGAVSLLAETIADAKDDPEAVEKFAKSLAREAKRLRELVKDVIQLSRFQSTELVGTADLVDLSNVVRDAIERNNFRAEQRNIKVSSDTPEGIEVFGDAEMLTVAVKNLVENAINYSDENSTVGIGVKESNGIAAISVTDSGVGLSVEDQTRIFERFYRVDPSRSRDTGGTGLGLAIVKHVALTHQGEVRVFSKPGVGSTFTLRLPLADTKIVVSETERTSA
jgi:two-component system sensor histidine kinase SenX3